MWGTSPAEEEEWLRRENDGTIKKNIHEHMRIRYTAHNSYKIWSHMLVVKPRVVLSIVVT